MAGSPPLRVPPGSGGMDARVVRVAGSAVGRSAGRRSVVGRAVAGSGGLWASITHSGPEQNWRRSASRHGLGYRHLPLDLATRGRVNAGHVRGCLGPDSVLLRTSPDAPGHHGAARTFLAASSLERPAVTQCHGQRRVSSPGGVHGCVSGLPARFTVGGLVAAASQSTAAPALTECRVVKVGLEAQPIATTSGWRHGRSAHGLDGIVDVLRIGSTPHLGCTWLPAPPVQQGPGCTGLPAHRRSSR